MSTQLLETIVRFTVFTLDGRPKYNVTVWREGPEPLITINGLINNYREVINDSRELYTEALVKELLLHSKVTAAEVINVASNCGTVGYNDWP